MKPNIAILVVLLSIAAQAQSAKTIDSKYVMEPTNLVGILLQKPIILNVGPRSIYNQAHIPGAEYIGMASQPDGIKALRERAKKLPKDKLIVIYCGCCPWEVCPNVAPAFNELKSLGFTNLRVVHIAQNFGHDWVAMGFPVAK
jgi:thiosulfate/3-mercaptopyruvate sulfurtransferase